jgi:hypothetical protein
MRFVSRIALALLAVLFAWRLGPAFVSGLASFFPAFGGFVTWLLPNMQGRSALQWFEFVVAIFLFWLIFKGAGVALGFMVPQAQLFGTTKALRRFQGLCGEGFIIFSLFIGVSFIDAMMRDAPRAKPQENRDRPLPENRGPLDFSDPTHPNASGDSPEGKNPLTQPNLGGPHASPPEDANPNRRKHR